MTEKVEVQRFLEKQKALEQQYKLSQCRRYILDQEEGTLQLTGWDHYAMLEVLPAGIYDRNTQSWQWGWDCWDLRHSFREKAKDLAGLPGQEFATGSLKITEKHAEELAAVCLDKIGGIGICRLAWEEPGQVLFCLLIRDVAAPAVSKAMEEILEQTGQKLEQGESLFAAFGRTRLFRHMGTEFLLGSLLAVPQLLAEMKDDALEELAKCLYDAIPEDWEEEQDSFWMLLRLMQEQGHLCFFRCLLTIAGQRPGGLRRFCEIGLHLNYVWGKGQYRDVSHCLGRLLLSQEETVKQLTEEYLCETGSQSYDPGGLWLLHPECVLDAPAGWPFLRQLMTAVLTHQEADTMGYHRRRVYHFLMEMDKMPAGAAFLDSLTGNPLLRQAALQAAYEVLCQGWEKLEQGETTVNAVCGEFQTFARRWLNDRDRDSVADYDYRKMEICQSFLEEIGQVPGKLELDEKAVDCLAKTVAYAVMESDPEEKGWRPDLALMGRLYEEGCPAFFQLFAQGTWADVEFAESLYQGFDGKYRPVAAYLAQFLLGNLDQARYMERRYLLGLHEEEPRFEAACWLMDVACISEDPIACNVHGELMMSILEDMPKDYEEYDRVIDCLDKFLQAVSRSGEPRAIRLWEVMAQWLADTVWSLYRCYAVFANRTDWLSVHPGCSDLYCGACARYLNTEEKKRRYRLGIVGYLQEELGLCKGQPDYDSLFQKLKESVKP